MNNVVFVNKFYKNPLNHKEMEAFNKCKVDKDDNIEELDNQKDFQDLDLAYCHKFGVVSTDKNLVAIMPN
jgi:hypothetical protein